MNTSNDFYRLAKEGEKATHDAVGTGILPRDKNEKFPILSGTPLIKCGWFSPDEKPLKQGRYLVKVKNQNPAIAQFESNTWWAIDVYNLEAWAHVPVFERKGSQADN